MALPFFVNISTQVVGVLDYLGLRSSGYYARLLAFYTVSVDL